MTTAEMTTILAEHPFLEGVEPDHLVKLAEIAKEVTFHRDEMIFQIGDEAGLFYLVLDGMIALEVPTPARTFRIETITAGEELGWSSLLNVVRKQFQARCLATSHALAFDGRRLNEVCERDHEFGYWLMRRTLKTVAERLQAVRIQLIDMYKPVGIKPL